MGMNMKQQLHTAMQYLAGVCDGAHSEDGMGFAKGDSYNGKFLASQKVEDWTLDETLLACHYATKYRGQLGNYEEIKDAIANLEWNANEYHSQYADKVSMKRRKSYRKPAVLRHAEIRNGAISIFVDYNPSFVEASRKIPSRRWRAVDKSSTFAFKDVDAVLELCDQFEIEVKFTKQEIEALLAAYKDEPKVTQAVTQKESESGKKTATLKGDTIELRFPYSPETVAKVKSMRVARWNPDEKIWTAPMTAIQVIKSTLTDFIFDEGISTITSTLEANKASYNVEGTDYRVPVPGLKAEYALLSHQWVPVEKALKNKKLLIADSQGLGKTLSSLAAMRIGKVKRAVVIAPAPLVLNWLKESAMFFEEGVFKVFVAEGQTPSEIPADVNLVLIGWPNISFWEDTLKAYDAEALVVDEAHYGKSGKKSKRGDSYIALGKHYKNAIKIALTGTPILNRPLELLAALQFLGLEKQFGGITKFKNRYCGPEQVQTPYGTTYTYKGATNIPELHDILVSTGSYLRRTKKMLIDQGILKNKYVNGVEFFDYASKRTPTFIKLNSEEQKIYAQIDKDFRIKLEEEQRKLARSMGLHENHPYVKNALASNKGGSAITLLTEMRKSIGMLKVRAISDYVQQLIDKGERVVIFAHHREVVDAYAERFGGLKIQGGMGAKKIEEVKAKFNGLPIEEAPVLSVSIEAGKTGHTLCLQEKNGVGQNCAIAIFAEEPYVYGDYEQAEDRIYRIGQSRDVYIHNLMVEDTVDQVIYNIRESKRAVFNAVIDGVSLDEDNDDSVAQQVLKELM